MVNQNQAQALLASATVPFLTTDEVALLAGVKPITISMWIARGYAELRGTVRPGRGKAMLFTFSGLIEILSFAHLSRLGFPPSKAAGTLSELVMSSAMRVLADLAGVWGDPKESPLGENYERYILAWYDHQSGAAEWSISSSPDASSQAQDASWLILDSHKLLDIAVEGVEAIKEHRITKRHKPKSNKEQIT